MHFISIPVVYTLYVIIWYSDEMLKQEDIKEHNKRDGRRIKAICDRFCFLRSQEPQETFSNTAIKYWLINELGGNWNTTDDAVMMKLGIKGIREFPFRDWADYKNTFNK